MESAERSVSPERTDQVRRVVIREHMIRLRSSAGKGDWRTEEDHPVAGLKETFNAVEYTGIPYRLKVNPG